MSTTLNDQKERHEIRREEDSRPRPTREQRAEWARQREKRQEEATRTWNPAKFNVPGLTALVLMAIWAAQAVL